MVQPVIGAINAWLAIYAALPFSVKALMSLAIALLIASKLVVVVFSSR